MFPLTNEKAYKDAPQGQENHSFTGRWDFCRAQVWLPSGRAGWPGGQEAGPSSW